MDSQNIIKIIFAIVIILVIAIYPILNIPVDDNIIQVFGAISVWLFGISTQTKDKLSD